MRKLLPLFIAALVLASLAASAADPAGDWKRGRIYYRMVCTACHQAKADMKISPMERTIAEWQAFFDADKHGSKTVSHFTSLEYRESIKADNRAAEKLIDVPADELFGDVRAWLVRGAKDSDTPARCQ